MAASPEGDHRRATWRVRARGMDFATVTRCNRKVRVAPKCVSGHTRSVRRHDRDVVRPADPIGVATRSVDVQITG